MHKGKTKMVAENKIEDYLINRCKKEGILCYKFTSPGQNGVPDRILLYRGQCLFVETKATKKKPRPLQKAIFEDIQDQNIKVIVADSKQAVDKAIKTIKDVVGSR